MNMKQIGLCFFAFLVFCLPKISFGAILYSQIDSSTLGTTKIGANVIYQTLGTGLTGNLESISLYLYHHNAGSGSDDRMYWRLYECTASDYATCDLVALSNQFGISYNMGFDTKTFLNMLTYTYPANVRTTYTLNASKYYKIWLNSQSDDTYTYGSSGSTYSNGGCYTDYLATTPCSTIADVYFLMLDNVSSIISGQFTNLTPTNNAITPTYVVPFTFTFYNNSSSGYYDRVGVKLTNVTDGQELLPLEGYILSSGSIDFATSTVLQANKQYLWRAYMRSSTASSTTLYSSSRSFYTVSSPYPQTTIPDYFSSTSTPVNPVSTTTMGISTTSGGIGSTTVNSVFPSDFMNSDIGVIMRTKVPFSYLFDASLLFKELAGGVKQPDPSMTLPMGATYTNFSTGATSTTFTVVPTQAIVATGYLTQIRTVIGYAIYLSTALLSIGAIMSAI